VELPPSQAGCLHLLRALTSRLQLLHACSHIEEARTGANGADERAVSMPVGVSPVPKPRAALLPPCAPCWRNCRTLCGHHTPHSQFPAAAAPRAQWSFTGTLYPSSFATPPAPTPQSGRSVCSSRESSKYPTPSVVPAPLVGARPGALGRDAEPKEARRDAEPKRLRLPALYGVCRMRTRQQGVGSSTLVPRSSSSHLHFACSHVPQPHLLCTRVHQIPPS